MNKHRLKHHRNSDTKTAYIDHKTPDIDDSRCLDASSTPASSKQCVKAGELSSTPPMLLENNRAANGNNDEIRVDACPGCDSDISINIHQRVV